MDYKIVEVIWEDALFNNDQVSPDDACKTVPFMRNNVGYCLSQEGGKIILGFGFVLGEHKDQMWVDGTLCIPSSMVKEVRILK